MSKGMIDTYVRLDGDTAAGVRQLAKHNGLSIIQQIRMMLKHNVAKALKELEADVHADS